ncbi:MAG: hypothetical protein V7636_801, partial [Actinomycetota bacterium]
MRPGTEQKLASMHRRWGRLVAAVVALAALVPLQDAHAQ